MPRREGPGRLAARNDPWPVDGPPIQGQHKRVGCLSRFASRRAATTGSSSQDGERCSGMRIGRGWPNRTSCSTLQSRSPLTGRRSPATSPCVRCGPLSPNMSDGLARPGSEQARDTWDLAVIGHRGNLSFTGIRQPWLAQSVKRSAAEQLPRLPRCQSQSPGRRRPGLHAKTYRVTYRVVIPNKLKQPCLRRDTRLRRPTAAPPCRY